MFVDQLYPSAAKCYKVANLVRAEASESPNHDEVSCMRGRESFGSFPMGEASELVNPCFGEGHSDVVVDGVDAMSMMKRSIPI